MTEKLGFEEIFRDSAAVDRNEGAIVAAAGAMDRFGSDFLAGAALAGNENRGL